MQSCSIFFVLLAADTPPIHLGREAEDECGDTLLTCEACDPFEEQSLTRRENTTFRFTIGPAASQRGYTAITGESITHK